MRSYGREKIPLNKKETLIALLLQKYPTITANKWQIKALPGSSGGSFCVKASPNIKLIARFAGKNERSLGINRQRERKILRRLTQFVAAPQIVGADNDWLLLEWLAGEVVIDTDTSLQELYQPLGRILASLHSYPLSGYSLPLKQHLASYWYQIDRRRLSPDWLNLHHFFQYTRQPKTSKKVLAHLDIHNGNVLLANNGVLKLLDWEYAADCDLAFALATLFATNDWDKNAQHQFLHYYCQQPHAYKDFYILNQLIASWLPWVNYMRMMWYEVRWMQTKNPQYLALAQPIRAELGLV
ncbi:phosphotransferase [Arsenophonus sp. aPb]|uniref:phosphotransferase n=1 Tax=Arsenophonus sp. aPb TaxID=3041619 RepID=UPI0024686B2F|nr:phosphotransferase [Arsenophonus sp. aPb]WGL97294.1 phosphotransferase [Arsenophonus sp. aPb]